MDIVLLDYYLRLFAIIANLFSYLNLESVRDFLKSSVLKELNPEIKFESLRLFNEYYHQYSAYKGSDVITILIQTIKQIDSDIPKKQKFQILLRLLLFEKVLLKYSASDHINVSFSELIEEISYELNISQPEYFNCKGFITEKFYQVHDMHKLLIVSDNRSFQLDLPYLQRKNLKGQLIFLHIDNPDTILFLYKGSQTLTYNKQPVFASSVYFFNKGSAIRGEGMEPVYYNQVLRKFKIHDPVELNVEVRDLEFRFGNSSNGIHKLSMDLEAEQLIGIIGRSGVGKSTLINLLTGKRQPLNGSVTINGTDLHKNSENLQGIIGYVSQDDLLVEELTVFMNLLLNARLCFGGVNDEVLKEKVKNLLLDLDLYEVRNLQVGSTLNRLISGGQRKKLNIALELIREPWILFADEPTSGLSSSDSEEIMQLLSEQTTRGRIVVVNIHQPSSDIFKMFDKIVVLDKEGYPVYFGNPLEAIPYFNDYYQRVFASSDICTVCENVNPEAIFRVLEEKRTNEFGEYTNERKATPDEWHKHFQAQNKIRGAGTKTSKALPPIHFKKPGAIRQFFIYAKRNLLTKLANFQYILLLLTISPVLAVVLASLCRYNNIDEGFATYSFGFNENMPSYFFMSVIVALFLGLIMSAEEIIRDRKILMREAFLRLSKLSYINSKVAFVFGISALQSYLYVVIGNAILDIQGMTFSFWLIMFSTSSFASLIGLFISSVLNSVIAIYILVPLIIVPQMLLSGVVVDYNKLNKYVSSREYVPFVGDAMASRWAYEAMVVKQFSANGYQKYYFKIEHNESNVKFNLLFAIPEIKKAIQNLKNAEKNSEEYKNSISFIDYELNKLGSMPYNFGSIVLDPDNPDKLLKIMDKLSSFLSDELNHISHVKDSITNSLVQKLGDIDKYLQLKNKNYNTGIADLVLKRKELQPYTIYDNKIIRELEPVYQSPLSAAGRAHFLAACKRIGGLQISAFNFNIVVIWIMSLITYILLVTFNLYRNPFHSRTSRSKVNAS